MNAPAYGGTGPWLADAGGFADVFLALPLAAIDPPDPTHLIAVAHLRDADANRRNPNYRHGWNAVLRAFNLLQFLPGGWWITHEGVASNRYPDYAPADDAPPQAAASTASADWEAAIELAAPELHEAMKPWAANGLPAPQVGYELADSAGKVLAEAELAWPERRMAVLEDGQTDADAFDEAGWQVYASSEAGKLVKRALERPER